MGDIDFSFSKKRGKTFVREDEQTFSKTHITVLPPKEK
jgi:hypothetical protein